MLDKKQFELFWVKMGRKVVERTCNINNAFGPGTANECTVQWWFKKFAKETRTLKMRSMVASHQKLTTINWEDHRSWSSYNTWEVAKELNINHSMVIQHLKQIGKVKRLTKWMLHELIKNQNYHCLECCLLSFYTTITNHFLIGLWYAMKSGFYTTTSNTSTVVGPRRSSKALPKAKLAPEKDHSHYL